MAENRLIFKALNEESEVLAGEVAARVGLPLPPQCVDGVAANARLLQLHADIMRGEGAAQ
ncbi:MAG: hypothetical protein BGO57_00980 [Sphingomonadales bacterium 63-6]|nr:MAG: hypothetical protein BGO57_00980 [Sphingomonadales bacterium 63-6]